MAKSKKKKKAARAKPAKTRRAKTAKAKTPARKATKTKAKAKTKPAKRPARKVVAAKKPAARKATKAKAGAKAPKRKAREVLGEGNYTASRRFRTEQTGFVKRNKTKIASMGESAEAALEGPEGDTLRAAEQEAASHAHLPENEN